MLRPELTDKNDYITKDYLSIPYLFQRELLGHRCKLLEHKTLRTCYIFRRREYEICSIENVVTLLLALSLNVEKSAIIFKQFRII